jgi:hypothetical protein
MRTCALASLLVALASLSGCATMGDRSGELNSSKPLIWEYPASAYPTMCISVSGDGRATFIGGFTDFNPARWRWGPIDRSLTIILAPAARWPSQVLAELSAQPGKPVLQSDEVERSITLRIQDYHGRRYLNFLNLYFYEAESCSAA